MTENACVTRNEWDRNGFDPSLHADQRYSTVDSVGMMIPQFAISSLMRFRQPQSSAQDVRRKKSQRLFPNDRVMHRGAHIPAVVCERASGDVHQGAICLRLCTDLNLGRSLPQEPSSWSEPTKKRPASRNQKGELLQEESPRCVSVFFLGVRKTVNERSIRGWSEI